MYRSERTDCILNLANFNCSQTRECCLRTAVDRFIIIAAFLNETMRFCVFVDIG